MICSGITEIGEQVLNPKWVSVPRGSEYFSFHIKNEHEEKLFLCEDDRYEMDAYINLTKSTLESLQKLNVEYMKNVDKSDEEFILLK